MSAPAGFPATMISGMPVVRGPAEIDIANAGLLHLTGVDQVIPNFSTVDEALSELPAIAIRPQRADVTRFPFQILAAS